MAVIITDKEGVGNQVSLEPCEYDYFAVRLRVESCSDADSQLDVSLGEEEIGALIASLEVLRETIRRAR